MRASEDKLKYILPNMVKTVNQSEIQKEKIGAVQQLSDKGAKICTSLE